MAAGKESYGSGQLVGSMEQICRGYHCCIECISLHRLLPLRHLKLEEELKTHADPTWVKAIITGIEKLRCLPWTPWTEKLDFRLTIPPNSR